MIRAAAAKATEAADALRAWLRDQSRPVFPPARPGPPEAAPGKTPDAGAADLPPAAVAAGHPEEDSSAHRAADPTPAARLPDGPEPWEDRRAPSARQALAPGAGGGETGGAPLRPAHTDWLHHRLTVSGPAADLAAFRAAAAGAGAIPWQLDLARLAEDFLHLLVAPPPPQQRRLSLPGARILAGQLRDAVARRHDLACARVGRSRACPFDLHALVPIPENILRRGPDDVFSVGWLWQHWGTTQALRHVADETVAAGEARQRQLLDGAGEIRMRFWSADWSPWRALTQIAARWPALRFDLRPSYDPP